MNCARCGASIGEGAAFCGACGAPVEAVAAQSYCARCGAATQAGSAFCVRCGLPLNAPGQPGQVYGSQGPWGQQAALYPYGHQTLPLPGRPAGFWIRLGAYLIDCFAMGLLITPVIVGLVILAIRETASAGPEMPVGLLIGYAALYPLVAAIAIGYLAGFWAWRGQTPGQMAVGLRVVRVDGSKLSIGRSLLRVVGYWVSGLIFDIGFLMVAWDERKQGLHDKIADTLVIHTR